LLLYQYRSVFLNTLADIYDDNLSELFKFNFDLLAAQLQSFCLESISFVSDNSIIIIVTRK